MSVPYSKRLGVGNAAAAGTVTLGTVPSGKVWIIRDVIWIQIDTGSARGQLSISGFTSYIDYTPPMAQWDVRRLIENHIVLNAGESCTITPRSTTAPFNLRCMIFGYELDA